MIFSNGVLGVEPQITTIEANETRSREDMVLFILSSPVRLNYASSFAIERKAIHSIVSN